ncbi:segregation and condensation protein A [Clostridiisalibacter paucivorans]|uniref:segregation and condensation protein A n=1 Tax=Clostridiisalibacter paucivorans TaxID=408753 RepID=UPI00047B9931|nr:segregation/condensation protein A [Clostridiisalibacter paucivorans]
MEYKIILESFEGPFDLLFHLIEKAEVDIYDIPIAKIADQYIEYIEKMDELDLDITSEFLVMASTLVEIKSKMLLPKQEKEGIQLEFEETDPREELVRRLMEYKKYKEAAKYLKEKEEIQKTIFYKPKEEIDDFVEDGDASKLLEGLKLCDLIKALDSVIKRVNKNNKKINIEEIRRDEITIEEGMHEITLLLKEKKQVEFNDCFKDNTSRANIIVMFISILELMKLKLIKIVQQENFGNIFIMENTI